MENQKSKICISCNFPRFLEEFQGRRNQCKLCIKNYNRSRYLANKSDYYSGGRYRVKLAADPLFIRKQKLAKYGLTIERYEELLVSQGNKCKICGIFQQDLNYPLHVDHCHKTGKVRGLLCRGCNSAIGFLNDDPAVVGKALLYLETSVP